MAEKLQRYNQPTDTWVDVASVERVDIATGTPDWEYPTNWPPVDDCPLYGVKTLLSIQKPSTAPIGMFGVPISLDVYVVATGLPFTIDWGDGTVESFTPAYSPHTIAHTYKLNIGGSVVDDAVFYTFTIVPQTTGRLTRVAYTSSANSVVYKVHAMCSNASTLTKPPITANIKYARFKAGISSGTINQTVTSMFSGCASLERVIFDDYVMAADFTSFFDGCRKLRKVNISKFASWVITTRNYTQFNFTRMFQGTAIRDTADIVFPYDITNPTSPIQAVCTEMFQVGLIEKYDVPLLKIKTSGGNSMMFAYCYQLKYFRGDCSLMQYPSSMFANIIGIEYFNPISFAAAINLPGLLPVGTITPTFDVVNSIGMVSTLNLAAYRMDIVDLTYPRVRYLTDPASMFQGASVSKVIWPTQSQYGTTRYTSSSGIFSGCTNLIEVVNLGSLLAKLAAGSPNLFQNCANFLGDGDGILDLTAVSKVFTLAANAQLSYWFDGCKSLIEVSLDGQILNYATMIDNFFLNCTALTTVNISPDVVDSTVTTLYNFARGSAITAINLNGFKRVTTIDAAFLNSGLTTLVADTLGASATSVSADYAFDGCPCAVINLPAAKLTKISAKGSSGNLKPLRQLTFHPSSLFGGSSPHINVSYTDMTAAELDALFTSLPTLASKTIAITGATGAAGCTRSIATAKGWTVTG